MHEVNIKELLIDIKTLFIKVDWLNVSYIGVKRVKMNLVKKFKNSHYW